MRLTRSACITAIFLAASLPAKADVPSAVTHCDSCHGPGGVSLNGDVPSLAGQSAKLIEKALQQFQFMERPCRKTNYRDIDRPPTTMCQVADSLSEEEMTELSEYYAALDFVPARQEYDPTTVEAGEKLHAEHCESCHPAGGSEIGYGGRLYGQRTPYLRRVMAQVQTGEIMVPGPMERTLAELTDTERDALLQYWAQPRN